MAIIYKWDIPQMNAHIQAEGEDNVIYTVHYRYTGSEESYADTEAFEDVVIGWLEDSLDVPAMQTSIAATIALEIAPVNEDLYFTWQNPVPPVPPVED